jgi:hypothetical protein
VEAEASVRTVTFQLCAAGIAFGALFGIISVLLLPLPYYKLIRSISHWIGAICVVSGAVCGSLLIGAHFSYTNRITLPVTAALNQNGALTGYSASAAFSGPLSLSGEVIMFVCCLLVLISRLCVYVNPDDSRHAYRYLYPDMEGDMRGKDLSAFNVCASGFLKVLFQNFVSIA